MLRVSSLDRADFVVLEMVTLSKVPDKTSEFEVSKQCENFLTHCQSPITTHLVLQEKHNGEYSFNSPPPAYILFFNFSNMAPTSSLQCAPTDIILFARFALLQVLLVTPVHVVPFFPSS